MNFFFATILLFIGLLLPALIGLPFVRFAGIAFSRIERLIVSLLFGWLVFCAIFAVAGFADFRFSLSGGIFIILFLSVVSFCLFRRKQNEHSGSKIAELKSSTNQWERILRYLLILLGVIIFAVIFIESIGDTESMPMQAVWGYKAKVFYLEGRIPVSFFTDPDIPFTHQSYPLLFPIMLTWSYFCMGGVYEPMLKVIPPLLGVLIYLSLYGICRREGCSKIKSLMISTLFCGGATFNLCSTILYAENLLILYELWGVYFLYLYLRNRDFSLFSFDCQSKVDIQVSLRNDYLLLYSGFILLAGGACVKNEGVIYFGIATVYTLLLLCTVFFRYCVVWRKKEVVGVNSVTSCGSICRVVVVVLISGIFLIVPWMLFRYFLDVPVGDFSIIEKMRTIYNEGFVASGSYGVLKMSVKKFIDAMFVDLTISCGVWYFLATALIILRKQLLQKEVVFLILMIFVPIAIFAASFIFSTRPLGWHMDAIPRLLLIPTLFSWLLISSKEFRMARFDIH